MSLDIDLLHEDIQPQDQPLGIDKILAGLDAKEYEALLLVLNNTNIAGEALAKALKKQGFTGCGPKAIRKWRERNDVQ